LRNRDFDISKHRLQRCLFHKFFIECSIFAVLKVLVVKGDSGMDHKSLRTDDCVEEVINEYSRTVYKLAYARTKNKSDAEDVFQEVFLRYIRKHHTFESKEHEKAWFIRVTVNCCKNIWSSPFRKRTQPLEECMVVSDIDEVNQLEEFLLDLSKDYRVIIHLFYYEDMSTSQISKILRKKESTVRVQLTRGRRLLKEIMEGAGYNA